MERSCHLLAVKHSSSFPFLSSSPRAFPTPRLLYHSHSHSSVQIRHAICRRYDSPSLWLTLSVPSNRVCLSIFGQQPNSLCRSRCNFSGSDMIPHLEIGKPEGKERSERRVNGVFWIILLNLGIYLADHVFQVRAIKTLYLYHNWPTWYQFITAAFCHANWKHLSSNLFFLYIFGKLVEEEEGNFALWFSYILTGAGANLVSWLVLSRNAVSVGASGAVFGLFAISVLVKMSWDWRKILEVLILGQFVIERVMEAAQASTALSNGFTRANSLQSVNHIAHLSGALVGVLLVWLVSRIPSYPSDQEASRKKSDKI